jgi:hypothetical protein
MFTSSVAIIYIEGQKFLEHWKEKAEREVPDERTLTERIESYYYDKSNAMRDFKRLAQFSEDEFYNWFRDDFARTLIISSDEGDTIPETVVSSVFVETEFTKIA